MYYRSDQNEYYNNVLLPLERDTLRHNYKAKRRRNRRRFVKDVLNALRGGRIGSIFQYAKAFVSSQCEMYRNQKNGVGLSPPQSCFSDKRVAVYTAIFGNYDQLHEPGFTPDNVDYFVYTDGEVPAGGKWKKRPWEDVMDASAMTGTEKNRYLKMFPHLLFPEYEYSVYVDGNNLVTGDLTAMAARTEDFPVAMHLHKTRDCVYKEIDACIATRKNSVQALTEHRTLLKRMGVPEQWGLLAAAVIARRHHDPLCIKIMETWWDCFLHGCRRDQIGLIHCLWKLKIDPVKLSGLGKDAAANSKFIKCPHNRS